MPGPTGAPLPSLAALRVHGPAPVAAVVDCDGKPTLQIGGTCYFMATLSLVQVLLKDRKHDQRLDALLNQDSDGEELAKCIRDQQAIMELLSPEVLRLYLQILHAELSTHTFKGEPEDDQWFFGFQELYSFAKEKQGYRLEDGVVGNHGAQPGATAATFLAVVEERNSREYEEKTAAYKDRRARLRTVLGFGKLREGGNADSLILALMLASKVPFVFYYGLMPYKDNPDAADEYVGVDGLLLLQRFVYPDDVLLHTTGEDDAEAMSLEEVLELAGGDDADDRRAVGVKMGYRYQAEGRMLGHAVVLYPCTAATQGWLVCDSNTPQRFEAFEDWAEFFDIPQAVQDVDLLLVWERTGP